MSYYRHNRRSNNRFKSAQHDNIDRQILCLHQAMAKKLLADQSYLPQIIDTIESRHKSGKIGYGSYLFWTSLLEHIKQPDLFLQTLLEDSPIIQKYRRQTPFVGILTETERQAALDQLIYT
jgi:hypothetical protein